MFKKILFPTDFSKGAFKAIENFAKNNNTEIEELILLHVIEESVIEEIMDSYSYYFNKYNNENEEIKDIEKKLKERNLKLLEEKKELAQKTLNPKKIKIMVKFGTPYKKIIETAIEEDVSMILLPSHGKLDFTHEFLGSTTHRVILKTKKPVLLIKIV